MANKTPTATSFSAESQPSNRRGKSFKTMVIDALKKNGKTEEEFIELLVQKAVADGGVYLTELMKRYYPHNKQTYDVINFEYDPEWTAVQKADKIMASVAMGDMPPDIGMLLIDGIAKSLGIEEVTELARRLEAIEKLLENKQ